MNGSQIRTLFLLVFTGCIVGTAGSRVPTTRAVAQQAAPEGFVFSQAHTSWTVKIADADQAISAKAGARPPGEAQSVVVPPGKKSQCPQGRFLVTNDWERPGPAATSGLVYRRDLGATTTMHATIDKGPINVWFNTNDHDLVLLPDGDVLYATGALSKQPLDPKPAWFDNTFRNQDVSGIPPPFGPGARSVVATWRSSDCGETFQFLSVMDPARMEDGSCAYPARRPPDYPPTPPFDAGGSDGQWVQVDPLTGLLYLTFGCVGSLPGNAEFDSLTVALNKTLVAVSKDKGASWTSLGFAPVNQWRFDIARLSESRIALGNSTGLLFGQKGSDGKFTYGDGSTFMPFNVTWGDWHSDGLPYGLIKANRWGSTIITRVPNSEQLLLAFPAWVTKNNKQSNGFRIFFYDPENPDFLFEADPIVPQSPTENNIAMHLVAIEPAVGPVMLYWTDIDSDSRQGSVYGRFVLGPQVLSTDFVLSRSNGQPRTWNLSTVSTKPKPNGDPNPYFYGDYQTAGGFQGTGIDEKVFVKNAVYNYFPMWIEPDGTVRFTTVAFNAWTWSAWKWMDMTYLIRPKVPLDHVEIYGRPPARFGQPGVRVSPDRLPLMLPYKRLPRAER